MHGNSNIKFIVLVIRQHNGDDTPQDFTEFIEQRVVVVKVLRKNVVPRNLFAGTE